MAEISRFWDGNTDGDAVLAPYDSNEFAELIRLLFQQDPTVQGVIDGYLNSLALSKTGTTVYLSTGAALVYGRLYENSAIISFDCSASKYYRVVLRCDWTAKTVRAVLLSNVPSLPALTQTPAATYEINLCDIYSTGAALTTFTDRRVMVRSNSYRMPRLRSRYGDINNSLTPPVPYLDWNDPLAYGDPVNPIMVGHTTVIQTGKVNWTGAAANNGYVTVTFPKEYNHIPIVFVTVDGGAGFILSIMTSVDIYEDTVDIYWRDTSGGNHTSVDFSWIAIGQRENDSL